MKLTGETVYVDGVAIENVLVHIGEFERGHYEQKDIKYPTGVNADYTLYFPMDYTEDLTKKTVVVRGYDCKVLGHPDHERPKQVFGRWIGSWDMTVRVQKTLASYDDHIIVYMTTVSRDVLGNRTTSEEVLFNGLGQARKASEDEKGDSVGATETETWYFVVPFLEEYKTAQTQQLRIQFGERSYDVKAVEDIDWEHNTASLKAVWHG